MNEKKFPRAPRMSVKRVTNEMVEQRARLYADEAAKQTGRLILENQPMADSEYHKMFREAIEVAFRIGHAAGVSDQHADPSLAVRSP